MIASDEILTIVHAFPDEGRKASLRALADRVRTLEAVASFALNETDSTRLLDDLQRGCSPDEAKRRISWAKSQLRLLGASK